MLLLLSSAGARPSDETKMSVGLFRVCVLLLAGEESDL